MNERTRNNTGLLLGEYSGPTRKKKEKENHFVSFLQCRGRRATAPPQGNEVGGQPVGPLHERGLWPLTRETHEIRYEGSSR